jgi:hypothetical protein
MTATILDNIPFHLDFAALLKKLRMDSDHAYADTLKSLVDEAEAIARPKALYKVGYIDTRQDDRVVIDGIPFTSRVLCVNLEQAHRVFAFTATCGTELEAWLQTQDDMLYRYWADIINEMALRTAIRALKEHLEHQFELGRTAVMNPGSLEDWPLSEQMPLFTLLGDPEEAIGVKLLDSFLMSPQKSVSGIRFPTEERFESCQLCPREDCPGRRAPYDEALYAQKYQV